MGYDLCASMKLATQQNRIEFIHPKINPLRIEAAWFKWEFLRRNREYQADHRKFVEKHRRWFEKRGYWYDYKRRVANWTKADEDYFYAKIAPSIYALCKKWQIGNLFPPDWKFDRRSGVHSIRGWDWGTPTDLPPEMNWDPAFLRSLFEWRFSTFTTSAKRIGYLLAAEFDLSWPMKDLVDYAQTLLAYAQGNYREELKQLGMKLPVGRRRAADYATHLQAWDLRRVGKRPAEISAIMFPAFPLEEGTRRVRDHLKAAERLIDGHYKEIR